LLYTDQLLTTYINNINLQIEFIENCDNYSDIEKDDTETRRHTIQFLNLQIIKLKEKLQKFQEDIKIDKKN